MALPIWEIRRISSSDNTKSKMSMFSDSRSIRDVRGIADNVLLHQPAQTNLRGGLAVGPPDPGQRLVVLDATLRHRTIGDHSHALAGAGLQHLGLVEVGMVFDLIAHQRRRAGRNRLFDQGHGEVRDADVPGHAELPDMRQRAQRFLKRHLRIWPVQQQQIDFGKPQLGQALLGGTLEVVRREMGGPDLGRHEYLVASDPRGAQTLADLALVLIDLRGVDVAIAEPSACSTRRAQVRPRSSQVPNPIAGILAPLASTNCMRQILEQIGPHYVPPAIALPTTHRVRSSLAQIRLRQSGKHRFRGMGYHGEKRPRRSARHALALLPVSDGLDRHAEPCREFQLRQARAPAKVANRRERPCRFGAAAKAVAGASGNSCPSRNSTIRPSAFSRKRCMFDPALARDRDPNRPIARRHRRRCALRFD